MAQPRPPPGGPPGQQGNPYAQRSQYDSQLNGREAQYPGARSTTALIGAQESQTSLPQFPSYGAHNRMGASLATIDYSQHAIRSSWTTEFSANEPFWPTICTVDPLFLGVRNNDARLQFWSCL